MRKNMIKIISVFLALLLTMAYMPFSCLTIVTAEAAEVLSGSFDNGVVWSVDENGNLVFTGEDIIPNLSGSSAQPWISVKDDIRSLSIGDGITKIGNYTFMNLTNLETVYIGTSVTSIGQYAFSGDTKITDINIPDSVTVINENAFRSCSGLKNLSIGTGVANIGKFAFFSCGKNIESLVIASENEVYRSSGNCIVSIASKSVIFGTDNCVIPTDEDVTAIGANAFYASTITDISIPKNITTIDPSSFLYCSGVQTITVAEENPAYSGKGNCLVDKATGLLMLGSGNSVIPDDGSVRKIADYAFYYNPTLTAIEIPGSVSEIGASAFTNCRVLAEVIFNEGLKAIGSSAFYNCRALNSVELPDSLEKIGNSAFAYAALKNVVFGKELSEIGGSVFSGTYLKSVVLPSKITEISNSMFSSCAELTEVILPDSVTRIGLSAFANCWELVSAELPAALKTIEASAFNTTKITSVHIPAGVSSVDKFAFSNTTALKSITVDEENPYYYSKDNCLIEKAAGLVIRGCCTSVIPDDESVVGIADAAFCGNPDNMNIVIPENIKTIGNNAFYRCSNLSVTILNPACEIYDQAETIGFYNNIIYGHENSTAQAYAEKYSRTFVVLKPCEHIKELTRGETIEFGSYPQSKVTDGDLITALTAELNGKEWASLGYFSGNGSITSAMSEGDYGKYCDVEYNGEKYRAVKFDTYRPVYTYGTTSSVNGNNYYQYTNGYLAGTVYWFKYEPIRWIVGNPLEGYVLCLTILDSRAMLDKVYCVDKDGNGTIGSDEYFCDADGKHYANNYAESSLRRWLNDSFLNTAFSDEEKAMIAVSDVDNPPRSSAYEKFAAETTQDKVFIPGYNEFAANFSNSPSFGGKQVSDYAFSQGLYPNPKSGTANNYSSWWLRSAGAAAANYYFMGNVGVLNTANNNALAYGTDIGVCPAMRLSPSALVTEKGIPATCTTDGSTDRVVCSVCHEVITESTVIKAKGHVEVIDKGYPATCTTDGLTDGSHCTVCETVIIPQKVIPALGHTETLINAKEATETEPGYTGDIVCSECGEFIKEGVLIPAGSTMKPEERPDFSKGEYHHRNNGSNWDFWYENETFVNGTQFVVDDVSDGVDYESFSGKNKNHRFQMYDLKAQKGELYVQPDGEIWVAVSLPGNYVPENTIVVYINGDTYEKMPCFVENGKIYFCTTHFSHYVILDLSCVHDYVSVSETPTCTETGRITYICQFCDHSYSETIPAAGHTDKNTDGFCDECGKSLSPDPSETCSHLCHKSGFLGFFWKIVNFFNKLFKINQYCECGAKHW